MSETLQIWLFAGAYALFCVNIGLFFGLNNKLIRLEVMLEVYGKKVAKQLHSPTNHHGLDNYLDKYIDQNYDMSLSEWQELQKRCEDIEEDSHSTPLEKDQAAFIAALCTHKLMRYGIKPKMQQESTLAVKH